MNPRELMSASISASDYLIHRFSSQVNTLQNWLSEFNTWVPPPESLSPDADPELARPRTFKVHILNDEHK